MSPPGLRRPAVAGRFYPAGRAALERELDRWLAPGAEAEPDFASAVGCLVPHAGYQYSGEVAGAVYRRLPARPEYIILGPNHFGQGAPLALMAVGAWATPLGQASLNSALARVVRLACPLLTEDAEAHATEHSLEVQIPFLQRRGHPFSFLPIAVGVSDYDTLEELGHAVATGVKSSAEGVLIVASSDLNHYEPDGVTRAKDRKAIDRILNLDAPGLWETIFRERISMCGFGPAVALLVAARDLGATRAELVRYATSADAGGPRDSVVGYAGIVVSR
ncbi:MAG TPA: AmmeMemoRadiSam system protein B [Terriglobia bacterium]|nr:AmmeMemoRadiSam system protein B [Terriglobia bacterium]